MKYQLINKQTGEKTPCDKVTIDGFDYYVSDEPSLFNEGRTFLTKENIIHNNYGYNYGDRVVICTNNPNLDIPQIVDEDEELALKTTLQPKVLFDELKKCSQNDALLIDEFGDYNIIRYRETTGFITGYKKSQETHPFSEEDMIEFYEWSDTSQDANLFWMRNRISPDMNGSHNEIIRQKMKELLQLWKEQRPKKVYYGND